MTRHQLLITLAAAISATPVALGQAIGPDLISSSHSDVARNGTSASGAITAYSIGAVTCNHGDMPALVMVGNTIRPHMAQGMYRLKTYTSSGGSYQRFEEIGQGWAKRIGLPIGGTGAGCGTCQPGAPTGYTGVNCGDTYSSGFNTPTAMSPRTRLNATTGEHTAATTGGGTDEAAINTRLQVLTSDVTSQPAGTRFFVETVHLVPHDSQYVRPGQTVAVNAMNNAASQEIAINGGTSNPTLLNGLNQQIPAVQRWKDLDPTVTLVTVDHDDTPNPHPSFPGTFLRSRYYVGAKVYDLGGAGTGPWRYEYVVFNLNSDRCAGAFSIPLAPSSSFTEFNFRHPPSHSGEGTSNAPWIASRSGAVTTFSTQKYADNSMANAIRWASTYNFGFTSDAAPTTGSGLINLFKPGALQSLVVPGLPVPTVCTADIASLGGGAAPDHQLTADDVIAYLAAFFAPTLAIADIASLGGVPFPDGQVTPDDLITFLASFFAGCP